MEYPPFNGGVANYYSNLVKHWPEPNGLRVLFKKYPASPAQYLLGFRDLSSIVSRAGIDHIIVGQILPLGAIVYIFNLIFHKPYTIVLHGLDLSLALSSGRKRWLVKKILGNSQKIICANNYVAKLVNDFSANLAVKIAVVNPGVEKVAVVSAARVLELKQQYNLEGQKVILTMGRLVKRKGVDTMLSVLASLDKDKISNWRYVVLGAGPDEAYLKRLCQENGLDNLVIFIGETSEIDKWSWLDICTLLAMPTRNIAGDFEGFGIVYLEANLMGKPVLATASGGVSDAVLHGVSGLLVEESNLALNLEKLMGNEELGEYLGQKGRWRAQTEFNWLTQAQRFYSNINFNL